MSRSLALALVLIPGLALAQAEPPADEEAIPRNFGDPAERPMPPATPPADPEASPDVTGGPAGAAGVDLPASHMGMRDARDLRRGGHGPHHHRGQARIAIEDGDRTLRIECGETPIADCIEGAQPLLEILR